jgi:hypothetical protein
VRSDTNLVRAGVTVVADHRAHRVRAVVVVVAGCEGRAPADEGRVVPVVVVVVRTVGVAPAVLHVDGAVRVPHAGVDVADDDPLAAGAERRPGQWSANGVQAPLGREGAVPGGVPDRVGNPVHAVGLDLRHFRERCDRLEHVASRRDLDGVVDPERPVANTAVGEERAHAGLATEGDVVQAVEDELAARIAVRERAGRGEVCLFAKNDPEGRLALG